MQEQAFGWQDGIVRATMLPVMSQRNFKLRAVILKKVKKLHNVALKCLKKKDRGQKEDTLGQQ